MSWERISESIALLRDTCNVYCVHRGNRAILIDAGSGAAAEALGELGVEKVDWVLHTHHHRDQCWGTPRLRKMGARVAVPEYERSLFAEAELFWRTKRVYDNYNDRNTFFASPVDIPVDRVLEDYEEFEWEGLRLRILPAKGHTYGSSMLVGEIDGKRVAFTGDLVTKGGKLYQYHSLEYGYGDRIGGLFTLQSAKALRKESPDLALPSHGEPITDPVADCAALEQRLVSLWRLGMATKMLGAAADLESYNAFPEPPFIQLSPHLLWGGLHTCSNFYVILSDSGKACLVDYGHSFHAHMATGSDREDSDTMRFVVHHLDELREVYHVKKIDVVLITHIHDDHTVGIPYLQRHEGTEAWALDTVSQVLKDPAAWCSTPCTLKRPIRFAREFRDGETFRWEEFAFVVRHAPGQTEFHSVIGTEIDGQKVAFTGDNIFESPAPGRSGHWENQVYQTTVLRNSYQLKMHRKCADVMDDLAPDLVCPGHRRVIEWDSRTGSEYRSFVERQERVVRELIGEPAEQFVDLFWARLLPYLCEAKPSQRLSYTLLLRNNLERKARFEARLLAPPGWPEDGPVAVIDLEADAVGELPLEILCPAEATPRRAVTAEILIDGASRGPIAEALATVAAG
jgi:glyoxylase-like metal-dependent hydrolase (beta-lactamase superfamily II)